MTQALETERSLAAGPSLLLLLVAAGLTASACSGCDEPGGGADARILPDAQTNWARGPDLPEPVSNNALASVETEGGCMIFSLLGIDASLQDDGIHNRGFRLREGDDSWMSRDGRIQAMSMRCKSTMPRRIAG
ncbi:MAG: hypothetical protein GY811_06380 [Myxococcales bacterium]|nr:hypothetical protein [Myxococcales bacterium]